MKIVIHPDFAYATAFVKRLPEIFEQEGELLYDGRNKVKRYRVNDKELVVKRYKRPNIIQRITYTFFKKSKTERAYLFAGMLRERGFDTPHEVAYIEQKKNGLFQDGFFVSLNCGYPPISQILRTRDSDRRPATKLAAYIAELHKKGILHGDLNLTNILYHIDDEGNYLFTLIDTNRSIFKSPSQKECLENLKRVTHNKSLLRHIVTQYAIIRGWNPRACALEVFRYLLQFEHQRRRKRKFQSWIGIKK